MMTCSNSSSSCGLAYRDTTEGGGTVTDYIRTCVPTSTCGKVGSISYAGGRAKMAISCCNTDGCTSPTPILPGDSNRTNGLMCPTCKSTWQNSCSSVLTMQCTGKEQICLNASTTTSVSMDSTSGCATASLCDVDSFSYFDPSTDYSIFMDFSCFPATKSSGGTSSGRGNPPSCLTCAALDTMCTDGPSVTCSNSSYSCGLAYRETTQDLSTNVVYIMSCVPKSQCGKVGSLSFSGGKMKMGISCCSYSDNCAPPLPTLPADNDLTNGLQCSTCRSANESSCTSSSLSIQCTGSEQTCVSASATSTMLADSAQGCATTSLCDVGNYYYFDPTYGYTISMAMSCSPANNTATSLSCNYCASKADCTGVAQSCADSSYSCGLAYRETTEGGSTTKDYLRSCVPTSICGKIGSITYSTGRTKMQISCCNTDSCIATVQSWPSDGTQTNGVVCKTCKSTTIETCTLSSTIQCTGNEQTCVGSEVSYVPSASAPGSVAVGCGTASLCDVKSYTYTDPSGLQINMVFACSNAQTCTQTCSTGTSCGTAYRVITQNGGNTVQSAEMCIPNAYCNNFGTMTVSSTSYSFFLSCCSGTGCQLPNTATTSTPNAVKCKTCDSYTSASCDTTNTMTCSGEEDQCVTYTLTAGSTVESHRGCGRKILCDIGAFSLNSNNVAVKYLFTCEKNTATKSNGGIYHLLLSVASLLVIIKMF
ncbi:serine-rich adhesin for platelets-like isoform X2 [Hyperolius riggenbachi]